MSIEPILNINATVETDLWVESRLTALEGGTGLGSGDLTEQIRKRTHGTNNSVVIMGRGDRGGEGYKADKIILKIQEKSMQWGILILSSLNSTSDEVYK